MTRRILTTTAVAGAALVFAVPAWGDTERPASLAVSPEVASRLAAEKQSSMLVIHDHGDATDAKLAVQSSPQVVIHDHGDATDAKLAVQSSPQVVIRDHGDATQAKLTLQSAPSVARERAQRTELQSPPTIVRDHGDATQAKLVAQSPDITSGGQLETTSGSDITWSQLGMGFGVGLFFVLGVILAVRFTRSQRLAH